MTALELSTQAPAHRRLDHTAVVYQIYPRSFQDSNGDGVGDLPGITSRLDYLQQLGIDALWLSPIYPSPNADYGYDISDYCAIDPVYGALEDFDTLVAEAHRRDIGVVLDIVPCHTSIEHPWFRQHPDWYIWSPVDGPANNWVSAFGGRAWSRDDVSGRWYLHSFYPEQPDLNWRNPEVVAAMHDVFRFWRARGVDGFRLDAIGRLVKDDQLRDNPPRDTPPPLWENEEQAKFLQSAHHLDQPETLIELLRLREVVPGAYIVAEAYHPNRDLVPYLECVDTAFAFELLQAPLDVARVAEIIGCADEITNLAWVLSNHDFPRLVSRWGEQRARCLALLLLTLPGGAFIYQGDELGLIDGDGGDEVLDRWGRDKYRHPMQWTPVGGFTTGRPWLPMVDPGVRNAQDQERDEQSVLRLYRRLLALRRSLGAGFEVVSSSDEVLVYRRGTHHVVVNLSGERRPVQVAGRLVLSTGPETTLQETIEPYTGWLLAQA